MDCAVPMTVVYCVQLRHDNRKNNLFAIRSQRRNQIIVPKKERALRNLEMRIGNALRQTLKYWHQQRIDEQFRRRNLEYFFQFIQKQHLFCRARQRPKLEQSADYPLRQRRVLVNELRDAIAQLMMEACQT